MSRQRFGGLPGIGLQASLAQISHYGCWCFFQDDHHLAKGPPQNEVDEFCKVLHNGYECAIIDSDDKEIECTPWKVDYNTSTVIGNTAEEVETNCVASNSGYCEQRACIVENFFILNIFSVFFTSTPFDPNLKHDLGFDYEGNCLARNDLHKRNFENTILELAITC